MRATRMIAPVLCLVLLGGCGRQHAGPSVFQMRLVQDASSEGTELMTLIQPRADKARAVPEALNVERKVLLDAGAVSLATVRQENSEGDPVIEVVFTEAGRRQFADLTRQSIGRRLAVVVDGKLVVAPRIESEIPGGKAVLSGRLTKRQATDLAAKINDAVSR